MQLIFEKSEAGRAVIEHASRIGTEQLVVTLHPGTDFYADFEFKEGVEGDALIASSGISIDRETLKKLVQWLREAGALD